MKHLSKIFPLLILLVTTSVSLAIEPPVKMWEKWYYSSWYSAEFHDIELNQDGNLFITGIIYDYTPLQVLENYVALLMDQDGNILREVLHEFDGAFGYDGVVLEDGSYVITGVANDLSSSSTLALYLHKISSEGNTVWAKVYDYPGTKEEGYGITCLPDGGFAVCGRVHGTSITLGQAWILRMDANGDTLWTETWGTVNANWGKSILYADDMLCILTNGADDTLTTYGSHLLFYDLDGNYLYGSDYPNLYQYKPGDLCKASDGGVTFVTKTLPVIWHTDQFGETLWWHNIPTQPANTHEGFCIRQTMDSGYIFSGWTGWWQWPDDDPNAPILQVDTGSTQEAWLVRYSEEGEYLWGIAEERGDNYHYYSCLQLPQGGYMACGTWGGSGYLARYAPETGIEETEPAPASEMNITPNPFNSTLSVSFTLREAMNVSLTVYDLSGRLVNTVTTALFPAGNNIVNWTSPEGLSSGCYLIRLDSPNGSITKNCILLY